MSSTRLLLALASLIAAGTLAARAPDRLTSRSLPDVPADKALKAGDKLVTGDGEQRRVRLPDRSLVYVRQGTSLSVTKSGALELTSGEVFVETAIGKLAPALTVKTAKRTMEARDSRFGVRAGKGGTAVVVATGSVKVGGVDDPVRGGQQLDEKADKPARAPRVAHLIAWTRELRNASSLVPGSEHAGGTLVARDPDGQEAKLELRRYHVDVHVEDGFARTTIDQTYFNHALDRLEGTFRFPLPPDASLSRLAMYVDGKLMEGGMAERDHARSVYERIVWEKRDPALLEWVDGSTFKMRVFPLEPRQEKRIVLSYTQRLRVLYGQQSYRFPAGHSMSEVAAWSLHVRVKNGKDMAWRCESHTVRAQDDGNDLILDAAQKKARLDRDVTLTLTEKKSDEVRFSTMRHEGANYLLVRYRPELAAPREPQKRDWVILAETSGDRDPLLARTQIELIRAFLANAGREDTFVILTGSTRAKALREKAIRNDLVAIEEVLADLEKAHLVGAFDLNAALAAARTHLESARSPHLVHVGSGIPAMGERRPGELLKKLPKGTRYVGVGVGRRWERSLMQHLAEKTGGYFTQVNPDESVGWRGLELASTLDTPRLLDVSVSDPAGKAKFLPFVRMISQGEELAAVARVEGDLPEKVRITGSLEGKEFSQELEVKGARGGAAYLPRSWAKLEIDRLLADQSANHKEKVVELSKSMYVMTPFTSLLVLENDDMYKQFKVDRGRKDHWAMYPASVKIKVVVEPIEGDDGDIKKGIKPSRRTVARSVVWPGVTQAAFREREAVAAIRRDQLQRLLRTRAGAVSPEELKALREEGAHYQLRALSNESEKTPAGIITDGEVFDSAISERNVKRSPLSTFGRGVRDLSNDELGLDGGVPLNYNVDRILPLIARPKDWAVEYNPITGQRLNPLDNEKADFGEPPMYFAPRLAMTDDFDIFSAGRGVVTNSLSGTDRTTTETFLRAVPPGDRPNSASEDRRFFDLLAYAPGLNTSVADLRAVLDAEARPDPRGKLGRIDPKAKALLDAARKSAWRTYTVPAAGLAPSYKIDFDGTGKYAWERTLSSGLKEKVVCDGKRLWHAYPELGLASKRTVSRHHRLDLGARVPFVAPDAEDIARGADLVSVDASTVALVPHGAKDAKKYVELRLVFDDGRLSERRVVEMPAKKVLRREVYAKDGSLKILGGGDKELLAVKGKLSEGDAPSLKANVSELVVLDLPYRTPEHVRKALDIEKKASTELTFAEATQLLAAHAAAGQGAQAQEVFGNALARRDERSIGYYVLLASAGVNLDSDNVDVLDAHPHEPLAHYLSLHSSPSLRKHASRWAAASNVWGDGVLRRLGLGHALAQRWSSRKSLGTTAAQRSAERKRALDYVRQYKGTDLAWGLLGLMQDRTAEEKAGEENEKAYLELAKAYELFTDSAAYSGLSRYERARCLFRGGQGDESRKLFAALHREARKDGALLRLDADFHRAMLDSEKGEWGELMRETAKELLDKKDRGSVLILAAQCHQLDDRVLARRLLAMALKDLPVKGDENLGLYRAAIGWLTRTQQTEEAERLVKLVLEDDRHAKRADLWRAAADLAAAREQPARALECREKALALEYESPSDVINLEQVRKDYHGLLGSYEKLTEAMATLKLPVPAGFRDRVIRAADRWRALDRDQSAACRMAAEVLRGLGERDLAFDYLTTPVGINPGESDTWVSMASTLARQGERDLADRAYASAFERESTNAQILWDRAENLRRAGRGAAATALYKQIATSEWQPRFASLKQQARWLTEEGE